MRTYPSDGKGRVYLCPDLKSEHDGHKASLAKVLKENGIEPKTTIDVRIEDGRWEIGAVSRRPSL